MDLDLCGDVVRCSRLLGQSHGVASLVQALDVEKEAGNRRCGARQVPSLPDLLELTGLLPVLVDGHLGIPEPLGDGCSSVRAVDGHRQAQVLRPLLNLAAKSERAFAVTGLCSSECLPIESLELHYQVAMSSSELDELAGSRPISPAAMPREPGDWQHLEPDLTFQDHVPGPLRQRQCLFHGLCRCIEVTSKPVDPRAGE